MDDGFADRVKAAVRRAREQYGTERETTSQQKRSRLVRRVALKTPKAFEAAADASDGLLRYRAGKWGSYSNDSHMLDYIRPDGARCRLEIVLISTDRAKWQFAEGANAAGYHQWFRVDEMRDIDSFLEAKILELIDRYARGAEDMAGIRL